MNEPKPFRLGQDRLTPHLLVQLASKANPPVIISDESLGRLDRYRQYVDNVLAGSRRVYGINTGFGFLSDVAIEPSKLRDLQVNLIRSHACGVGPAVDDAVVRALLILRAHTFALGHSGVRRETVELILKFLCHDILPVVPCQGSVGASGDLAPLSHLAMGLMGEGEVRLGGCLMPAGEVLSKFGITPLKPEAKEGLSLINGTHFMASIGSFAVMEALSIVQSADICAGLSLDAVRGTLVAFDSRIQEVRPHAGQALVASNVRALFSDSDGIMDSHRDCGKVQDPYSFRCVPQVHGASRDVLAHVSQVIEIELNSLTDNPLVFGENEIVSGGNFHGQPIALAMDYLALSIAEIGSISERRIEKITNPHQSGLPPFAMRDSGLNSGYMIPHVVAAALVSENKILCHPASVDSIPTSADKEDHVSMGPIAARKARVVAENVRRILAIEFLAAAQGLDLLSPLKPSKVLIKVLECVRGIAPMMEVDRSLHKEIERIAQWIHDNGPRAAVQGAGIEIV